MADERPVVSDADASAAAQNSETNPSIQDLQARATKAEQKAAQLQQELDALQPYVTFDRTEQNPEQVHEETPQARKPQKPQVDEMQVLRDSVGNLKLELFYSRNPDLEKNKDLFEGAFMRTDERKGGDQRLAEAAKMVRDKIEALKKEAIEAQKAEQEKSRKAAAATDGIVDGGSTAPEASPKTEEGWSPEEYAAARKKQQQEMYGAG